MSGGFECLNCSRLGRCPDTDEEKLKTQYHCVKWEGAISELVLARNEVIRTFGASAFPVLLTQDIDIKEE